MTGITGIVGENLEVGQKVAVSELRYQAGANTFLAEREGDIFVTELGPDATIGQLQQIGVFGDKQNFAIQFSEEAAFFQGAKVSAASVERSIYTIPGPVTLKGEFTVQRIR